MQFLLNAVDEANEAIEKIFGEGRNPPNLRRITTNEEWNEERPVQEEHEGQ